MTFSPHDTTRIRPKRYGDLRAGTIWRCSMFIVDWLRQAIAILILIGDVIYLNFGRRTGGLPPPAAPAREPADRLEHDRRARQRFPNHLPIIIITTYGEIRGVTRDLSSGDVFFYVDDWPLPVSASELTMLVPSEITFSGSVRAVCRGRVVRVEAGTNAGRLGVAATFSRSLVPSLRDGIAMRIFPARTTQGHTMRNPSEQTAKMLLERCARCGQAIEEDVVGLCAACRQFFQELTAKNGASQ